MVVEMGNLFWTFQEVSVGFSEESKEEVVVFEDAQLEDECSGRLVLEVFLRGIFLRRRCRHRPTSMECEKSATSKFL